LYGHNHYHQILRAPTLNVNRILRTSCLSDDATWEQVMIDSGFQTTEDATQEFRPNL